MKKQWKWAIGVVVFCILAPIIWTTVSLGVRFHAIDDGAVVASEFLGALRSHNYAAAQVLLAPSKQATTSVAAIQRAQEQIEMQKGLWLTPAERNESHPNQALNEIIYFYSVGVKSNGGMPIMVRVIRIDSEWRILEYQYDDDPA